MKRTAVLTATFTFSLLLGGVGGNGTVWAVKPPPAPKQVQAKAKPSKPEAKASNLSAKRRVPTKSNKKAKRPDWWPSWAKFCALRSQQGQRRKECISRLGGNVRVFIPSGAFWRGEVGSGDAAPMKLVSLDGYWMDKYEVTVGQFQACVKANHCLTPYFTTSERVPACNYGSEGRSRHPINCVNWYVARAYCRWDGGELCTEAQWEKAARGPASKANPYPKRTYPWGNRTPSCGHAVFASRLGGKFLSGCGKKTTWPVGRTPMGVSFYGVMDLAGNVWEWTRDGYDANAYKYAPKTNPFSRPKPKSGQVRVVRGGGWAFPNASFLRVSYRDNLAPNTRSRHFGFRCCARTDSPPAKKHPKATKETKPRPEPR